MPNWCFNIVSFSGEEKAVKKVIKTFKEMKVKQAKTGEGQLPPNAIVVDGFFFDISIVSSDTVQFNTRWAPNTGDIQAIIDNYGVVADMEYDECGNLMYGKVLFKPFQEPMGQWLEDTEFPDYDDDKEVYIATDGTEMDGDGDYIDNVLAEKIRRFGYKQYNN